MPDERTSALLASTDMLQHQFIELGNDVSNTTTLNGLHLRLGQLLRKVFADDDGSLERMLKEADRINYSATNVNPSQADRAKAWVNGCTATMHLLDAVREELTAPSQFTMQPATRTPIVQLPASGNRVFVVHGHKPTMKEAVARLVTKLGFEPIILHEMPNRGRTIIEKFEHYSDVGFAIVCLSADDLCGTEMRARQNVILELGYFLGKLGRERVIALHDTDSALKLPSDYDGVIWTPYDAVWPIAVAKEMRAAGMAVDLNKL